MPLPLCYETCLTLIHSGVPENVHCWVMQAVRAASSGMLWLQSWDNYRHAAGLSSSYHAYTWSSKSAYPGTTGTPANLAALLLMCNLLCTAAQAGLPCSCANLLEQQSKYTELMDERLGLLPLPTCSFMSIAVNLHTHGKMYQHTYMCNHKDKKYKLHDLYMDVVTAKAADAL